jgi:hypothetical protein
MVAAFTVILGRRQPRLFKPYFANVSPLLVIIAAILIAAACLAMLRSHGFEVVRPDHDSRWFVFCLALPASLAVPAILADIVLRFPQRLNVPMPEAALFYPAIGYVAEVAFHLLPLTLLLLLLTAGTNRRPSRWLFGTALLLVACIEPVFQLVYGGHAAIALQGFVALQVFAYGGVSLWVFRRYDFTSMYVFRLVYYAFWHVLWGALRLRLLF